MKQTCKSMPVLVFSLMGLSSVLDLCGAPNMAASDAAGENPLVFEETLKDVGDIPQGQIVQVEFKYQNSEELPIDDLSVQASCNCVAADIDLKTIRNKNNGSIFLRIDTSKKFGKTKNTATVSYLSDGKAFKQQLRVIANVFVDGKVVANVPVIDLGKRVPGVTVNKHLLLKRLGCKVFETQVKSIRCPSWVSTGTVVKDPNKFEWHVDLEVEIPKKYGLLQDSLYVSTNDPNFLTTGVPIVCVVEKPVTAKPSRILKCLGTDCAEESFLIVIDDKYKREVRIKTVTFEKCEKGFNATVNTEKDSVNVTYRGLPGSRTFLKDVMRIYLDIGDEQETVDVPIFLLLRR